MSPGEGPRTCHLRVGLTGGIASGKTTVGRLFVARGVPLLDADRVARDALAPGEPVLYEVLRALGNDLTTPSGALDRAALRARVFADPGARRRLEAILHPIVRRRMLAWLAVQTSRYCVLSIPLLFEADQTDLVDRALVVDVSEAEQVRRATRRDGVPAEQVWAIIAAQARRAERLERADDLIHNEGTLEALELQVDALHRCYVELSRAATNSYTSSAPPPDHGQ